MPRTRLDSLRDLFEDAVLLIEEWGKTGVRPERITRTVEEILIIFRTELGGKP